MAKVLSRISVVCAVVMIIIGLGGLASFAMLLISGENILRWLSAAVICAVMVFSGITGIKYRLK